MRAFQRCQSQHASITSERMLLPRPEIRMTMFFMRGAVYLVHLQFPTLDERHHP